ncbi:hypothetical protein SRHO_G00308550 [Serrasalmus rhombeus]
MKHNALLHCGRCGYTARLRCTARSVIGLQIPDPRSFRVSHLTYTILRSSTYTQMRSSQTTPDSCKRCQV